MTLEIRDWAALSGEERVDLLARPALADDVALRTRVSEVLDTVRNQGDAALREFTERFDGVRLDNFRVGNRELAAAEKATSREAVEAIDAAISNVRRFHQAQLVPPIAIETAPGVRCERVSRPLDAVGLYVPAGSAPLPSAAIMLAVPAEIAGCPVRVLCTPPRKDGTADASVIVAAHRAGVRDIYKIGGAQAIAALAYGTASVPKVAKIFGPGNAWVTAAKTLVGSEAGGPAIDMPAGPSEVLVIADGNANAAFVAADLLSQAEHGPDSQVVLLTTDRQLAERVQLEIAEQLAGLSRSRTAAKALGHSRIILVADIEEAIGISNAYAPEHLLLQCAGARELVADIRNAGSVFVGPWTPESAGDYCSGTNHVLPTYGYARNYSGLGVDQFLRQMTVQEMSRDGLERLGRTITTLANLEGLDAHAQAVRIRLDSKT